MRDTCVKNWLTGHEIDFRCVQIGESGGCGDGVWVNVADASEGGEEDDDAAADAIGISNRIGIGSMACTDSRKEHEQERKLTSSDRPQHP